jgi:hypothetical protein
MLRSDYIRRLMEQLSRVLARSRELELDGRLAESRAELDRAAAGLGLPAQMAHVISDESLASLLRTAGRPDVARQVLVAELFRLDALAARARGANAESERLLARAAHLYAGLGEDADALSALGVDGRATEIEGLRAGK